MKFGTHVKVRTSDLIFLDLVRYQIFYITLRYTDDDGDDNSLSDAVDLPVASGIHY